MSDETHTEAEEASTEHDASAAPAEGAGNSPEPGKATSGGDPAKRAGGAAKRRRRRGSRGGRNRRKPKTATAAAPDGDSATESPRPKQVR